MALERAGGEEMSGHYCHRSTKKTWRQCAEKDLATLGIGEEKAVGW